MGRVTMVEYSPYAYETHEDPYPTYRRLRDEAPAYRNDAVGFWALSRHADVRAAFRDHRRFSSREGVSLERSHADAAAVSSFIAMDPPRHDRMRGLVSEGFTPRRVAGLEPRIREIARGYLDALAGAGRGDYVGDFAAKLPMDVVSELLGVPAEDRDRLREWADRLLHREEGQREIPAAGIEASRSLSGYFAELLGERRRHPGDDLATALLDADLDGEKLTGEELVAFLRLMVIAGNETTTKLLGNAIYWAWRHPEVKRRLLADPSLVPGWVEETLRYDTSTQMLARTATEDVELHGRMIHAGDRVLLLIGSANRDERAWERPDDFDPMRATGESLSFGLGVHFCLGASLARLEARVALEETLARIADYEIDAGRLVRFHSANVRGFASVPLTLRLR